MIALGVGFSARCTAAELEALAAGVLRAVPGDRGPRRIATLERKRETGLLEAVAERLDLTPLYLSAEDLAPFQEGLSRSAPAEAAVGLTAVAEAAALAAAAPGARLVVAKTASPRATCAAAIGQGAG
ncbi:cobalamin biosynthesis protein [Thiohalorhabdus denitrificans]|uniref:Cobalt-precorrin 5A hydrolase n=1 Tax=Thiohalorhabdus denitrificans TaxID=381306 RepID=A0A1G5AL18_9GAMM|nr:cobalamin biosynthesis protein [Thiohalorhabdus denitrificans]SCX78583.1 cobalt-precorrin 5A hydrolase [Thiohalorhabdus denitrificans]